MKTTTSGAKSRTSNGRRPPRSSWPRKPRTFSTRATRSSAFSPHARSLLRQIDQSRRPRSPAQLRTSQPGRRETVPPNAIRRRRNPPPDQLPLSRQRQLQRHLPVPPNAQSPLLLRPLASPPSQPSPPNPRRIPLDISKTNAVPLSLVTGTKARHPNSDARTKFWIMVNVAIPPFLKRLTAKCSWLPTRMLDL